MKLHGRNQEPLPANLSITFYDKQERNCGCTVVWLVDYQQILIYLDYQHLL